MPNKIITYKCRNCGGPLNWDAEKRKFFCDYCNSVFTKEEVETFQPEEASEQSVSADMAEALGAASAAEETAAAAEDGAAGETAPAAEAQQVLYTCPSCGAEIVTDETTAASFCYFCHNPVVLAGKLSGEYMPDQIIPFAIDREQAVRIFTDWIGKKKFVPKDFYSEKQIQLLSGVYFPYWIYGCQLDGHMLAEGTVLRSWILGNLQYTEHKVYEIEKDGSMEVSQLSRLALDKANRVLTEGILPFDYSGLEPFHVSYLQGFQAERRNLNEQALAPAVQAELEAFAKQQLQEELSAYTLVQLKQVELQPQEEQWRYALLPVWTMTYKHPKDGKLYYFSINGQTGKTCGELPVDRAAVLRLFLVVFIPLFVLLLGLMWWI